MKSATGLAPRIDLVNWATKKIRGADCSRVSLWLLSHDEPFQSFLAKIDADANIVAIQLLESHDEAMLDGDTGGDVRAFDVLDGVLLVVELNADEAVSSQLERMAL